MLQCINSISVDLKNKISVKSDGVLAMIGKNKGVVVLFKNHIVNLWHTANLIKLYWSFMCEDNILTKCSEYNYKSCKCDCVWQIVPQLNSSNTSRSRNQYGDLVLFCEFRFSSFNKTVFQDSEWLSSLAFLVALTSQHYFYAKIK